MQFATVHGKKKLVGGVSLGRTYGDMNVLSGMSIKGIILEIIAILNLQKISLLTPPPTKVGLEMPGVGTPGSGGLNILKKRMELNWNFQRLCGQLM